MTASISASWKSILHHNSTQSIEFCGNLIVQAIFFWTPALIYVWVIPTFFPSFSTRHKIQKEEKQPTWHDIRECLVVVLRNQFFTIFVQFLLLSSERYFKNPPLLRFDAALPSFTEVATQVAACVLIREVLFYYVHRILHLPALYPHIHKTHHRYRAPVALSAQYAAVIEHFIANILPILLPPALLKSHIVTFWAFLATVLLETTTVHSGYNFFHGLAKKHDFHHEKFTVYFGEVGLLDWVHGTDGRKGIQKQKGE